MNRAPASSPMPASIRARGVVRASFARSGARTGVDQLFESGGLRLRFPNGPPPLEAVLINTGGGMAGGDQATLHFSALAGTSLALTTQSAEKIYRSQGPSCQVEIGLRMDAGAHIDWLPQETILFHGARLSRTLSAEIAPDASLTIAEGVVFGRAAMGETDPRGFFSDRWRIRRGGRLVFAENIRLDDDIAGILDRPACGAGARMIATFLHVGRGADGKLDIVRQALASLHPEDAAGASCWNDLLVARVASASAQRARAALSAVVVAFRGCQMPRVWQ